MMVSVDTPLTAPAEKIVERFNDAWNARQIDAVIDMITDDCVFENTSPFPDGERFEGKHAVRAVWEEVMSTPGMHFETEEVISCGDRVVSRWRYNWTDDNGKQGHIRGADIFRLRGGKIAEKLSYVKG